MEMPIGDIVDRYSICKLKSERLLIDNKTEIDCLLREINLYPESLEYVEKLHSINGQIWDLEADIRQGNEDILGLEEVGRRAIKIRNLNGIRVQYKNEINSKLNQGFIEVKMNHGSQKEPSVIITLSTVPERLNRNEEDGLKLVLKNLCEQNDNDYQVHFNVPFVSFSTQKEYIIPEWMDEYKLKYPHLRIFRTNDDGPPTKALPTILRVTDPETILITVDDDLVYHLDMVKEHRKYQEQYKDCVICYEGRGTDVREYGDLRDDWILCVTKTTITHSFQHYKSASYKRKLFKDNFFSSYVGKTLSDDILFSTYLRHMNVKMYVACYEPDISLFNTKELWNANAGVTSFPVVRYASSVVDTGCNNPELLKLQPKFFIPKEFENNYVLPTSPNPVDHLKYDTDKFSHGYFVFYNPIIEKYKDCKNVLEIGIHLGAGLRLLKLLFKNANVYGIDINDVKYLEEERIFIYRADQQNRAELQNVINNTNIEFDLILDDGGHSMKQQQTSLGFLFKHLKKGGVYIVEDLHTSRIKDRGYIEEDDEITTLDMLEKYQETKIITSNIILPEEKEYLNNNIEKIEIWSITPEKNQSVTSAIYKRNDI